MRPACALSLRTGSRGGLEMCFSCSHRPNRAAIGMYTHFMGVCEERRREDFTHTDQCVENIINHELFFVGHYVCVRIEESSVEV